MEICTEVANYRECVGVGQDVFDDLLELQESAPNYSSLIIDLMRLRCGGCVDI